MSYIAIKNFDLGNKSFKIGDIVPSELFEERLLRAKKIEERPEAQPNDKIEPKVEKAKKEKKPKTQEPEIIEEVLLTEDGSEVEVSFESELENSEDI